jgi:transposase
MLTRLFCEIDGFCQDFLSEWNKTLLTPKGGHRRRHCGLSESEIMTILVHCHQAGYRAFKWCHQRHVDAFLKGYSPQLPSYQRFIELMPRVLLPLTLFMQQRCQTGRGIAFIDSAPLEVCENLRIPRHHAFRENAGRGKSSTGWFYGFKLHLVVDDCGNILSFALTSGNADDRRPVPALLKSIVGKVFGDRGYISKALTASLAEQGIEWITSLKKNMKAAVREAFDALMLRKRSIIEAINDQLKNISQIEHTRHRSPANYMINVIAGLVAYPCQDKKPALNLKTSALVVI